MNKNKTNKALSDMEHGLVLFYNEMKWILNSKRGKNFQFMMLGRTFEAIMHLCTQIREKHDPEYRKLPKSPLDD